MNYIVFAFAAAAGIALIMIGILSGKTAGRKVLQEDENGYLRPVAANESTVSRKMKTGISGLSPPTSLLFSHQCSRIFPIRSVRSMEILRHA